MEPQNSRGNSAIIVALADVALHIQVRDEDASGPITDWGKGRLAGTTGHRALGACVDLLAAKFPREIAAVTRKTVERAVVGTLGEERASKTPDTSTVDTIIGLVTKEPEEAWSVTRRVRNALLEKRQPITLGPFQFWCYPDHLDEHLPVASQQGISDSLKRSLAPDVECVMATIDGLIARERERALELAEQHFRQLDDILQFMLRADNDYIDAGVFLCRDPVALTSAVHSSTRSMVSTEMRGAVQAVPIDHPALRNRDAGHDAIWDILNTVERTPLQRRILSAVEWTGRGRRDPNRANAFVQFIFALEALLQYQEKGVLVSPGIAFSISETAAFLIGSTLESRRDWARKVNRLYQVRSEIVHGRDRAVDVEHYWAAIELVSELIRVLLTSGELRSLVSIDEVRAWVEQEKYS